MRHIAQRQDIRDLILDAVDALLARYGYRKMTMDDVACQVGIGKGTIYLHFPGKEELILSHIDRIAERVAARLRAIAGSSDPAARRIKEMLEARVLVRFDAVLDYSQNLSDLLSFVRTALLARREAYFELEAKLLEGVLREGVRTGAFECDYPKAAARVLVLSTNALLPFSLSARELGRREDVADQVGRIADLLIKGLQTHQAPAAPQPPARIKTK